jgi:hypothetical protein
VSRDSKHVTGYLGNDAFLSTEEHGFVTPIMSFPEAVLRPRVESVANRRRARCLESAKPDDCSAVDHPATDSS